MINLATTHSAVMTVAVICSHHDAFDYVSSTKTLRPSHQAGDHVQCPNDTQVIGGGTDIAGRPVAIGGSLPFDGGDPNSATDDGWISFGSNTGTAIDHDMRTFAICEK